MSETKIHDWEIHYVIPEKPCMADCHTHGIGKYGHRELQIVLPIDPEPAAAILNILGRRIRDGEKFLDGQVITDALQNDEPIRFVDKDGLLRLIFRDPKGRWPEDKGCQHPYNLQETVQ